MRYQLLICLALIAYVASDVPVDCRYSTMMGDWNFTVTAAQMDRYDAKYRCQKDDQDYANSFIITISEPNVASDKSNNKGTWTLVYNQGFEVSIGGHKYFAWFNWTTDAAEKVTSYCGKTTVGWYHDNPSAIGALPINWGCYKAEKTTPVPPKSNVQSNAMEGLDPDYIWQADKDMAAKINSVQSSWVAGPTGHGVYAGRRLGDIMAMGTARSVSSDHLVSDVQAHLQAHAPEHVQLSSSDPYTEIIDWRNKSGINYCPMRDQLNCGSCYAFATTEMLSYRNRIETQNKDKSLYSVQDTLSCSTYGQGCDGGFPYLVGKYGEDYGIALEQCFGYFSGFMGFDEMAPCAWKCNDSSLLRGVTNYHYVGGYFGACNEADMMDELVKVGPIAVAFRVYPDFEHYQSGVYKHTNTASTVNPFYETNHAVLLVGAGIVDATGQKYWIVQNSWGRHFGDLGGFFLIERGTNECGIESEAVGADPVITVTGAPGAPGEWALPTVITLGALLAVTWVYLAANKFKKNKSVSINNEEAQEPLV